MAPVVERIAHDHRLELLHVDVEADGGRALAAEFGVQSLPTVVRFQDGRETHRAIGPMPRARLARQLGLSDRHASSSDHGSEVSNGIG
jgi:thioredoxin-like negative regulator of GroEL